MDRCHLKGETGDRLHAVLCAAGYNIRWLLRMIAKKGLRAMLALLLRLLRRATMGPKSLRPRLLHSQPALG
jgi:IS5 family transposase